MRQTPRGQNATGQSATGQSPTGICKLLISQAGHCKMQITHRCIEPWSVLFSSCAQLRC